ncbi:unnamed protein product [Thlaspi arvense]|uniref:Peptidase A1 domain-containing protein n=1 Tax=Thlaspi arvense TaxID=13288 RepID=A0AAU9R9W6_THLAR|nr:unnamed protein product [Thlaspi arvense]
MAKQTLLYCSLLAIFIFMAPSSSAHQKTLTVELIHRDSPRSPLFNPLHIVSDRLNAAFLRSISRSQHFSTKTDILSGLVGNDGEYFMAMSIGTPPLKVMALADTGSDLTWIQCKPCQRCYEQDGPIFDRNQSSTYKTEPCVSKACQELSIFKDGCDQSRNICKYQYSYGGGSSTKGDVATETLSIGSSSLSFPGTIIGCSYNNVGTFEQAGSGIIGLGGGPLSLISQLGSSIGKKFSYCLSYPSSTSNGTNVLNLGTNSIPSNPSKAITVGKTNLPYTGGGGRSGVNDAGNIIVDSGTTFTMIDSSFYDDFVTAVEKSATGVKRVSDPQGLLPYCFKSVDKTATVPEITMHFKDADVKLNLGNAYVKTSADTVCLTIVPATGVAIYGNMIQMGFRVGFNLETKTVSFQPMDSCRV